MFWNDPTKPDGVLILQDPLKLLTLFHLHPIRQGGRKIQIKGSRVSAIHFLDSDDGAHFFFFSA